MIQKILGFLAVLLIAVVAAINIYTSSNKNGLSDISLANVEALAKNEEETGDKWYKLHCGNKPGMQCQNQLTGEQCPQRVSCP